MHGGAARALRASPAAPNSRHPMPARLKSAAFRPVALSRPRHALQGKSRLPEAGSQHQTQLVGLAGQDRGSFRRPFGGAVRPSGEDPAHHPQMAVVIRRDTPARPISMQVLSRVLSYASIRLDASRPTPAKASGKSMRRTVRHHWSPEEIAAVKAVASPEVARAIDLAIHTGLRAGDLFRLSWSHVGENAIVITTGKRPPQARSRDPALSGSAHAAGLDTEAIHIHPDQLPRAPVDGQRLLVELRRRQA